MRDTFAARMALAVRESGRSLQEIATLAGTTKGQVSQWQTEGKVQPENIKAHVVESICSTLAVRPRWLLYGELPMRGEAATRPAVSPPEIPPGYVRFHMMEGQASGGGGVVNQDFPAVLREVDIAEWQVRSQIGFLPEEGRIQLITVHGDSMYPDIRTGDVMMVDTARNYFDGDGVYLINLNGYTMVKRLQMLPNGLHIVSTNTKYQSAVLPTDEIDTLHVAGRVVGGAIMRRGEEF
ncbi:S24 family peptidase [Stenotrophomonas tuberculopleuritidis]|uniref:S24 family peptidase n=1 Tax=Stenotrophomonas tuberculopleuritidis TaxID=3055079 RepID=UPI0026E547BA|nr:helix-turn-helix transcriptional regulator [Stenotrophomonas sp. 704A1]